MTTSFDYDYLPINVLTLTGYDFFHFIKVTLGDPEANLLKKISVKSTSSLLLTEDPFDIFNCEIEDEELESSKEQLSFKLKNEKFLIKPGVIAGFRSLRDALKKRVDQQATHSKKKKQAQQLQLYAANQSSMSSWETVTETQTSAISKKFL